MDQLTELLGPFIEQASASSPSCAANVAAKPPAEAVGSSSN
jgi:hypothetical protein